MSLQFLPADGADWRCGCCDVPLETKGVEITYLGSLFNVELLVCPKCGLPMVPEEVAMGRMLEVERLLEDK
ncbi:MAG: DVU_1557 family redox protein [Desulfovibrio sp.]|uniref:DVU_1557 family redox protein n=1 Tax=Desulfovibrio sp. 7SRBS1 TaxID=3378064 RepID=UPI003B3D4B0A